jgi:putative transposase
MDNLHKVSTDLIRNYDVICIEDLNVKGMIKNHKLSKHIADASWGKFIELLDI